MIRYLLDVAVLEVDGSGDVGYAVMSGGREAGG
jgi:hypothetical protein